MSDSLLMRLFISLHIFNSYLIILNIIISCISHIELSRDFLPLFMLPLLLLLEIRVESIKIPSESAHSGFLRSVFILEIGRFLAEVLVLGHQLPHLFQSEVLVFLGPTVLGSYFIELEVQSSQSVLVVLNLLILLVFHVRFRVLELSVLIFKVAVLLSQLVDILGLLLHVVDLGLELVDEKF